MDVVVVTWDKVSDICAAVVVPRAVVVVVVVPRMNLSRGTWDCCWRSSSALSISMPTVNKPERLLAHNDSFISNHITVN